MSNDKVNRGNTIEYDAAIGINNAGANEYNAATTTSEYTTTTATGEYTTTASDYNDEFDIIITDYYEPKEKLPFAEGLLRRVIATTGEISNKT